MAPVVESSYLPSLDRCVAGDVRLISWRTAYRALADEEAAIENNHLEDFFQDTDTIAILSRPLEPFPAPSGYSAKRFDTLTAPINVSQNSGDDYNLDEIKADAKWLSKEVEIEEPAALRMAIVEWQERPHDQLLNTARNGPGTISRAADLTNSVLTKSTFSFSASTTGLSRPALDFAQEDVRRTRLLQVFLSERNHVVRLAADLVGRSAVSQNGALASHEVALREHSQSNWLDRVAGQITVTLWPSTDSNGIEQFCMQCIDSVKVSLKQTLNQESWPKVYINDAEKEQSYLESRYLQLVNTLRLLLSSLYALQGIPAASTVQAWFEAMQDCAFLQEERLFFETIDTARLLVSVISVEILKLQLVVREIMAGAGMEAPALRGKSYIKDEAHVRVLGRILHAAASNGHFVAAPAIYAWSIIASVIKDIADVHLEMRLAQDDMHDGASRRGSLDTGVRTEFETFYTNSIRMEEFETQNRATPARFAEAAVDHMNVFTIITQSADLASDVYKSRAESVTAFICKETLLDLIRHGLPIVQYDAMVLEAILTILTPVEDSISSKQQTSVLAGKVLLDEDQFRPAIVDQALVRYPYELSPVLRLFQVLASARVSGSAGLPQAAQILESLSSFTQLMSSRFNEYQLEDETRNTNDIILTADISIFEARNDISQTRSSNRQLPGRFGIGEIEQNSLMIAAGTQGVILTDNRPFVLRLDHAHSALEYLGLLLHTFTSSSQLTPSSSQAQLDRFSATEVILLFNALLSATIQQDANPDDALFILGRLSFTLPSQSDIVSVVAEIFETELLAHLNQEAQAGSVGLATACAEFINVLVRISSERVWSILARSSLLGVTDGAISLVQVVLSETQSQRYRFLKACVELHSLLLDDAIAGSIKRKSHAARPANRFASQQDSQDSTSERTMSEVLNAYQKILFEVVREQQGWRFQVQQERSTIATGILDSFSKLLKSTQGVDLSKEPSKRLTCVLAPASQSLLGYCVSGSGTSVMAEVFTSMLPAALPVAEDAFPMQLRESLISQTRSLFRFVTILTRVMKNGLALSGDTPQDAQGDRPSSVEKRRDITNAQTRAFSLQLLQNIPILATLLASDHAFKHDLFPMLTELVQAATLGGDDRPSILALLDEDAQKSFLAVLTQLDRPLCDVQVERQVWDFLSAIMDSKQDYFAFYLLTGQLPKKEPQQGTFDQVKGKPILLYALDKLSTISILAPERALGMLRFVATAQRSWAQATTEVRNHSEFFKYTLAWTETLGITVRDPSPGAAIIAARECQMASYLCDILAIALHAEFITGDKMLLKSLLPKLATLRDHGLIVNAYNRSLHSNLAKNFNVKFTAGELMDFKRTAVNPAIYGPDYFYDRGLAASVLQHDPSWRGKIRGPNQGFSDEFSRANANLSLLDAQTKLLSSWKTLATALCECTNQETDLQLELAKIAERCLQANASPPLDQPGIADVLDDRIELAFVLMSKLVSLKVDVSAMQDLLPAAWTLVRTSPVDFDIASAADDLMYCRKLLQVLYLAIQPQIYSKRGTEPRSGNDSQLMFLNPAVASNLVDIVGKVIAPGFRALCANLHNDVELALPADFALLTALLEALLAVPEVNSVHTLLSDIVAGSSVIRGALSLYSWSDRLAEATAHDPIYGEVAVTFLLALSTVRPIAEQMALEGVLSQLASANLSNYFRKAGGKGPFDEPSRMFVIWTEGLLPLCLNLLDAVGAPLAAEVAAFLNSFPEQLGRAGTALRNQAPNPREPKAGTVTLSLVSEAHSLTMLALILKSDIALGAAEGVNAADIPTLNYDLEGVKEQAASLIRSRRILADRLQPTSMMEERWLKTSTPSDPDNLLLGKVIKEINSILASFGDSDT